MTTPQERVAEAVRVGQETVNTTVRTVTDSVQKIVSNIDIKSTVPTLEELVDRSYAFGVQILARQRDFTKTLIQRATPLTETLSAAPKMAERFVLKSERTAAKKAEDIAAKAEDTAAKAEDIATQAERTASKAQHSAAARSRTTKR